MERGQRLHHAGVAQEASHADYSAVPAGLGQYGTQGPALKRRAIFTKSLWDFQIRNPQSPIRNRAGVDFLWRGMKIEP